MTQMSSPTFRLIDSTAYGVKVLQRTVFSDNRGEFGKIFSERVFNEINLPILWKESIYSISSLSVIRGMHYQKHPFDTYKLVTVLKGSVRDVALCIDPTHPDYGNYYTIDLNEGNNISVLIPPTCAHGFLATSDNSIVSYLCSENYYPELDSGYAPNSFGYDWGCPDATISNKDQSLPRFI